MEIFSVVRFRLFKTYERRSQMYKILNCLGNKVMCTALVALGAFAAGAELVKTPILQTFEDENGTVTESVGYKVTGLENGEVAMVYTNHLRTATLRVRADLENVQFLVVGGGGGGGGGMAGPGGGGGGVVTGFVYKLEKNVVVDIKVGAGGKGGQSYLAGGKAGGDSSIVVGKTLYVLAYGGGAGVRYANGGDGGSGSGGGADKNSTIEYIGGKVKEAVCAEGVLFAESFGHEGGSNGTSQYSSGGGGGDVAQAAKIAKIPLWTFHGSADGAVPVCRSRNMVSALWANGSNAHYREYPDAGHAVWIETYKDKRVLSWFFKQKKK